MRRSFLMVMYLCCLKAAVAQKAKADSLSLLLAKENTDSGRVNLLWQLAAVTYTYNPDTAVVMTSRALVLAKEIKYVEGESRALGVMANGFLKIGNYPRALELYLEKLKIEEQRQNPRNLASVIMNIGIVYMYQEQYERALAYCYQADSIITKENVEELKYNSALNIGDIYNRLNSKDSAIVYFSKSLQLAYGLRNEHYIGASLLGIAHTLVKQERYYPALLNYRSSLGYLYAANDEDLICEGSIGMAKLCVKLNMNDSAEQYARTALHLAKKDGFLSWHLESVSFLANLYRQKGNMDSTVTYMEQVQILKDSISSKKMIRELQVMSSNEQLRQAEMEETKRRDLEERKQQLQWLFIGIFIPALFLITLLLSRIRIHVRLIKFMGIISLIILFEYLTLLLHPYVVKITHHTPVLELMLFVCIASLIIPTHHRIEKWMIEKLTRGNTRPGAMKPTISRLTIKKPSS